MQSRVGGRNHSVLEETLAAAKASSPRDSESASSRLDQAPLICVTETSTRLVSLLDPASVGAEKFRVLAIRLKKLQEESPLKKLLITSSIKGEGKSVISANLALALARRQRTLLIDGDLRQSGLRELLALGGLPGLGDWWRGSEDILGLVRRVPDLPLWCLPAGSAVEQPLEILQSQRLSEMLSEITAWFDWVIIDSPPLLPVADPGVWATHVDGALLVVRQEKTPKKVLNKSVESMDNLKLLGVVINEWEDRSHQHYANAGYGPITNARNSKLSVRKTSSLPSPLGSQE